MCGGCVVGFAELKNIFKFREGKVKKDLLNRNSFLFWMFYHVIACNLKISIYKVNSPNKKYVYSLKL